MVFYHLEPFIEQAGRKVELSCSLPSTRGEGTSQPIRSLPPPPFRSLQREVGGRQPGGPLEESAYWERGGRGGAVTLAGWQLFPLPSRELEEGGNLCLFPHSSHLPLITPMWVGGGTMYKCGSWAPGAHCVQRNAVFPGPRSQLMVSYSFRFVLSVFPLHQS